MIFESILETLNKKQKRIDVAFNLSSSKYDQEELRNMYASYCEKY